MYIKLLFKNSNLRAGTWEWHVVLVLVDLGDQVHHSHECPTHKMTEQTCNITKLNYNRRKEYYYYNKNTTFKIFPELHVICTMIDFHAVHGACMLGIWSDLIWQRQSLLHVVKWPRVYRDCTLVPLYQYMYFNVLDDN